ncbi:DDE_Tnp_1_7 domain-containing protein [Trichonephila clavipes]|nr:DDE_Tnp_1_7 domain-containing protein [Trichonephila clavipes]
MSLETFCAISIVVCFDNKSTRQERRKFDKLAAVRDVWGKWIGIQPKLYNPNENINVHEQFVGFCGRCPFKQYIPSDAVG